MSERSGLKSGKAADQRGFELKSGSEGRSEFEIGLAVPAASAAAAEVTAMVATEQKKVTPSRREISS